MNAVQFSEYGGPEVLAVVQADEPHAGPDTVRIAVRAVGVNSIDWKIRAGYMRDVIPLELPAGVGVDASGVVDEVGDGVDDVSVGDAVFGAGSATLAEHAVLTDWVRKPPAMSFEEAAGYSVPVETALRVLTQLGVEPGQTLVVSGAAGGVGSAVVQFAVQRGVTVIGTASARNQDYLSGLGATTTTYDDGWADRVAALAPNGVDAAIDVAGAGVIPDLVRLTGEPSHVLTIADFEASKYGAQLSTEPLDRRAALVQAARLFEQGAFALSVERTFPLTETAEAQTASAAGHVRGRLIVTVP